jgi:hypothetical protein
MVENNFEDAGDEYAELTPAQRADDLRHYYARACKILGDVSDRLGWLCYSQKPLGLDELNRLQRQLIDADALARVGMVGMVGMPLDDRDHYTDGTPVRVVENDSTGYDCDADIDAACYGEWFNADGQEMSQFFSADIWPVAILGGERIVYEPPHRRRNGVPTKETRDGRR